MQPLKQTSERAVHDEEFIKPNFDENGQQTGVEYYRYVYDENGKQIGEEKIDREADKKKREDEERAEREKMIADGDAEVNVEIEFGEPVGETEEELEAKKQEVNSKAAAIMAQDLPDEEKRAALHELFAPERIVTVV